MSFAWKLHTLMLDDDLATLSTKHLCTQEWAEVLTAYWRLYNLDWVGAITNRKENFCITGPLWKVSDIIQ